MFERSAIVDIVEVGKGAGLEGGTVCGEFPAKCRRICCHILKSGGSKHKKPWSFVKAHGVCISDLLVRPCRHKRKNVLKGKQWCPPKARRFIFETRRKRESSADCCSISFERK